MFKIGVMFFLMMAAGSLARAEGAPASASEVMSALRVQMDIERGKEQELQLLQLEVDRLKLEVEKKKAVAELGKIDGPGRKDGLPAAADGQPFVSLRYVFIVSGRKEAVFDVDGAQHRVQEGHEVSGQVVKGISAQGVSLEAKDGSTSFLRPGA